MLPFAGVLAAPDVGPAEIVAACGRFFGSVGGATPPQPFNFTAYYDAEMGKGLSRFWISAGSLAPAAGLADWKAGSRELEDRWRRADGGRRVNVDPGYLTPLNLTLATTKALPQAVYLRDGVFALVELLLRGGVYEPLPWTYPDYAHAAAARAFDGFRALLVRLTRDGR